MVCSLECVYKGINEIKAGSFKDKDTGELISYPDIYRIRFDQILSGLPKETEFR